ncbi:MAG: hypothetical protein M3Q52_07800 [Pseudomonadota bacterium]|nr:hypothetical protein [Pseudomonadota bacterium]
MTNYLRLPWLRIVEDSSVSGFGPLARYDTALRIGFWLRLLPARVYLHAGTRDGSRALGLDAADGSLGRDQLPPELEPLEMHEVEDFLCIYKGQLGPALR